MLVVGCGPVGLAITAVLSMRGFEVVASDFSAGRRALAEQLGAHTTIDPGSRDPLAECSGQRMVMKVIFECVGVKGMIDRLFATAPTPIKNCGGRSLSRNGCCSSAHCY